MKNHDKGLENVALEAAFSRSQFFAIWTDPKPANNIFIFCHSVNWLTSGFVYATLSLNWLTCRVQTIVKNLTSEGPSNSDTRQTKGN